MATTYAITENGSAPGLFNTQRFPTRKAANTELLRLIEIGHEGLKIVPVRVTQ